MTGTGLHQGDSLEKFKENILAKVNCLKLQTQENLLECFLQKHRKEISRNYTRGVISKKVSGNNVDFSTVEITSKKIRGNKVDFSTSQITPIKVRGNNVAFSAIKITLKKVRGNNVDFLTSGITTTKVRGNNMDFSTSEITSKELMEIWSSTYRRNIDIESTWIRNGVRVGKSYFRRIVWFL